MLFENLKFTKSLIIQNENLISGDVYSLLSLAMRSVNIVYKKGYRESCCQLEPCSTSPLPNSQPRRSVDNYYNNLLEKQQHRERTLSLKKQTSERNKLKSANNIRKGDLFHIIDTLNIASLPIKGPNPRTIEHCREQSKAQVKLALNKKLSTSRPVLAGLNLLPIDQLFNEEDSQGHHEQAKLKCLHKFRNQDAKGTVLAISVNFILDQTYFWQEQQIEDTAVKHWKMLQNYSNIAWVCRKEDSLKKIVRFSRVNNLRLDAVYLIVPKKQKKLLTVGYGPIQNDFDIKHTHSPLPSRNEKQLVVVNGLLVENVQNVNFDSFYHSIPIIKNRRSVVHYTKVDLNEGGRFGSVVKILSHTVMPKPFYMSRMLREFYLNQVENQNEECSCDMRQFSPPKSDILGRLQIFKKECVQFFERSMSLKLHEKVGFQSGETSAQYLIGDSIRRNYKIFKNYQHFSKEYQGYVYHRSIHEEQTKKKKRKRPESPLRYHNVAYLWNL